MGECMLECNHVYHQNGGVYMHMHMVEFTALRFCVMVLVMVAEQCELWVSRNTHKMIMNIIVIQLDSPDKDFFRHI